MIRCQMISRGDRKIDTFQGKVAILIPAYNEEKHLARLLAACRLTGPSRILIVDDCSTDRTAQVLDAELSRPSNSDLVHVLRTPRNLGKQGAVRLGLRGLAREDIDAVALIDGDGQHDPRELPALAALLGEFDLVIGARSRKYMPLQRRLSNWLVNLAFRLIGGVDFVDVQSGMRIYRKELLDVLAQRLPARGGFALEHESLTVLARHAQQRRRPLKVAAVPVSCSYGLSRSGIGPLQVLQLFCETLHQARQIRQLLCEPIGPGRSP